MYHIIESMYLNTRISGVYHHPITRHPVTIPPPNPKILEPSARVPKLSTLSYPLRPHHPPPTRNSPPCPLVPPAPPLPPPSIPISSPSSGNTSRKLTPIPLLPSFASASLKSLQLSAPTIVLSLGRNEKILRRQLSALSISLEKSKKRRWPQKTRPRR